MPPGNRLRPTLAGLLAVALAASACGSGTARAVEVKSSVARANANAAELAQTAQALDAFTGALYGKVAADAAGNVVLSPYSVAMALGMTRAGAVGATRTQLDAALRNTSTSFDAGLNAIDQTLTSRTGEVRQGDKKVELALRTANALWPQKGYPFQQAYLDTLAANYGAALHTVDYAKTEAARQAINKWVADQTNDKIENLIAEGVLSPLVRLVLTNAVYLNAPWSTPFDERSTAAAPFTRLDNSVVTADFMHASEPKAYGKGAGWQAVELLYAGEKLAMDIIVPDTGRFAAVDAQLTQGLTPFVSSLKTTPVQLAMPKFRFRTQTDLVDVLKALGVTDLFDPDRADLSGMTSAEKLFVSDVIHEAFIDVRESGTEAAAATAVVIKATAAPATPTALTVDRPFLFVIRDVETNTTVFVGRVVDPTAT